MSGPRRRYPAWIGVLTLLVLVLVGGVLYAILSGRPAIEIGGFFGSPDVRSAEAPDPDPPAAIEEEDEPTLRVGSPGEPVAVPGPTGGAAQPEPPPAAPAQDPRPAEPTPLERARLAASEGDWARALEIYDRLVAERPADDALALERARVIGWSGDYGRAADALAPIVARAGSPAELLLEHACYLGWAGRHEEADRVAGQVLALRPGDPAALAVQAEARASMLPSAEVARRWLDEAETPMTHLWLARALAREGRAAESLEHYRTALGSGLFGDSLDLEFASAAFTADSPRVAAAVLERYLYLHRPGDRSARILLAEAYAWAGMTDQALATYGSLLAVEDDPDLRFARAQLLAWSERERDAEQELLMVLDANPAHAGALKLLGDLALWRGEPALALERYRRAHALEPGLEGLAVAMQEAERKDAEAREAARLAEEETLRLAEPWRLVAEFFDDSEGFRWFGSSAAIAWGDRMASYGLAVHQGYSDGPLLAGGAFRSTGLGAEFEARRRFGERFAVRAGVGVLGFTRVGPFPTWVLGLELRDDGDGVTGLDYEHRPAVRVAVSAASLGAETVLDEVRLTHVRALGEGTFGGEARVERFDSELGSTLRYSGSIVAQHPLSGGLSAGALVRALAADRASPVLADWGALYWAPRSYVMPGVHLAYGAEFDGGWSLGLRATPGVAFIDERLDVGRRFGDSRVAVLEAGLDLGYRTGSWQVAVAGDWGGALRSGYRAAAIRVRLTPVRGGAR